MAPRPRVGEWANKNSTSLFSSCILMLLREWKIWIGCSGERGRSTLVVSLVHFTWATKVDGGILLIMTSLCDLFCSALSRICVLKGVRKGNK